MRTQFAIATTAMILILLAGGARAVQMIFAGSLLAGIFAAIISMMIAAGVYYILRPDPLAQSRAAVSEAAAATLVHPEVHQDPVLSRTILEADREQGTGHLGR